MTDDQTEPTLSGIARGVEDPNPRDSDYPEPEEPTSRGLSFDQECRVLALREAAHVLGGIRTPLNPAKIEPGPLTTVAEYIMTGPTKPVAWIESPPAAPQPEWRSVVAWSSGVFVAALALASLILGTANWLA